MEKKIATQLLREIARIENPYPADDVISCYRDFLRLRDYLPCYQFNPLVLQALIKLANDEWTSAKRISRLSLLLLIKQYMNVAKKDSIQDDDGRYKPHAYEFFLESRQLLFSLFRKLFEESKYIRSGQLAEAKIILNNCLINLSLTEMDEIWLCNNAAANELVLNRVLRYPTTSVVISRWAKENFYNDHFRSRRAEMLSWVIDQEPGFEIDKQTLIQDFEFLNKSDLKAIETYDDEMHANSILERELRDFLPKVKDVSTDWWETRKEGDVDLTAPELKLFRRSYSVPTIESDKIYPVAIPDFDKMRTVFLSSLDNNLKLTMIWGIAYSRIHNDLKTSLFKKYFCPDTLYSLIKIGKRTKNARLLKWLLEHA